MGPAIPFGTLAGRKLKALQVASGAMASIMILPSGAVARLSSSSHLSVGSLVVSPFWPSMATRSKTIGPLARRSFSSSA